jgi:hypothetical protein
MTLPEKLVALHEALASKRLPHAFGGAIALAYWVLDPRGTDDIDVNIFVPASDCATALESLPNEVAQPAGTVEKIERDGQVRLFWDKTPVDLFFTSVPIHEEAARHVELVPFEGTEIPILGPTELAIFKAMFDRGRDWGDIEEMLKAETLDVAAVRDQLRSLLGEGDPRIARFDEVVRRAGE